MHLISIHPQYVAAILSGAKTVECRKSAIGLSVGDTLMLYATAPIKAVLGRARVKDLHRDTPQRLWDQFQHRTCVTEADFFAYYANAPTATLIALADVEQFANPVALSALREAQPGFSPPQTARRLGDNLQRLLAA